jgi:tetratricopeptide (TPR) repeat protein
MWEIIVPGALALCLALAGRAQIRALQQDDPSPSVTRDFSSLQLDPARRADLESAINARDYKRAETILVEETERDPKSPRAAELLVMAGSIFFLDGNYLNSAIAWKRAEAITPLDERSRFTLAMAYVKLNRRDWARPELDKLAKLHPQNALYHYWLARLDYDAQNYTAAIVRLQKVVALDPGMMRGYDTLGLCYDYLGQFDEAIKNYNRAIDLNRLQPQPSPWPHVNLAVALISVNRLTEAETSLREALSYDAKLPQAHYHLGRVFEMQGRLPEAVPELHQAGVLDSTYPEPHFLLGRIYHRLGEMQRAQEEIAHYQELKRAASSGAPETAPSPPPVSN